MPEHLLPKGDSPEDRQARVRWQIEYYFSESNLVRDRYLRCLMDADGWVPVVMLAAFPKVARERLDLGEIIEALAQSAALLVSSVVAHGEEATPEAMANQALVRKAVNWEAWPLSGAVFIGQEQKGSSPDSPAEPVAMSADGAEAAAVVAPNAAQQQAA